MKKLIFYTLKADCAISNYLENYIGSGADNDLAKRAFRVSRIRACLTFIDAFLDSTYTIDGRNFIAIDNFAKVEYVDKNEEILIVNVYFDL
jgi:hypothetical protein